MPRAPVEFLFVLGALVLAGYVLGIVGFFRAASAHAEIRALRRTVANLAGTRRPTDQPDPTPFEPTPFEPTPFEPAPPPQIEPLSAGTRLAPAEAPSGPAASEAAEAQPAAADLAVGPPPPQTLPKRDLETLLTARWGVWLGSAALLLAGVFLIRYAVEQDLLGPAARCGLAALLGCALLATAEWLARQDSPSSGAADQAPAGLAAGGTAILFGAAYGAGPFYGLLPPFPAFLAMAAASLAGLAAALRFGQLTAATGIAGAFVTPALVATEDPSLPGLFAYLLFVSAAALLVVRHTAWTWLGWATTIAGGVWICLAAIQGGPDLWAVAAFVPAAAALNVFLLPSAALDHPIGRRLAWVPFVVLGVCGLLLESYDPDMAVRVGLFLLSPIAVWRGITEPRHDRLPWFAALIGVLTLLLWALPEWNPTGEAITVEGIVEAVLPGAWAPEVVRPLITAGTVFAAFHALAGLWRERRAENPLPWSALTAAVPVLTMTVLYAQIARFQADIYWAAAALALAAALTGAAAQAAAEATRQSAAEATRPAAVEAAPKRAGVHAAGAVAALALGCAMLLHEHWLTLAIALFLPALAWIEARADLPPLRLVALAAAALVLVRLGLNWYILQYVFGTIPVVNGLIAAYGVPSAAFALAAVIFRRRADDLLAATLEAGAVTFATFFVALEIRHGFGGGALVEPFGFNEIALHLLTMGVQATLYLQLARRTGRPTLDWAWRILGGAALVLAIGVIIANPAVTGASAGVLSLLGAYLVPAGLAAAARRHVAEPRFRLILDAYALVAGFAWITLQIRQMFHPEQLGLIDGGIEDAELWAWSGGWLLYGLALMALGIRMKQRLLRLTALGVIGLVCVKVFLIDMAGLTGLWRVLSFLGLGLALIGLGVVHRRFVVPREPPAPDPPRP